MHTHTHTHTHTHARTHTHTHTHTRTHTHTHMHTEICDDLSTLYDRLYTARNEWCYIGLKLNLSTESLNEIELKHDSKMCLFKMLTKRLQEVGPLSWREVCDCLRSPTVNRIDVAKKIEEWRKGTDIFANKFSNYSLTVFAFSNRNDGPKALYTCSSSFSFIKSSDWPW